MFVARHCYFFKTYFLILWCIYDPQVEAVAPTFLVPVASTAPRDVDENSPKDVSILTVEGQDGDGDTLTFSIFSQNPMSPPFELESNTGLFKTPNGLDAETAQSFTFVFSVSDGTSSVDSVPFTVNINDLNEKTPQFVGTPYEASLLNSVINGTSAFIVNATDADVTATITYSITGGNTGNTFAIDSNGNITVAPNANLTGGSSFTLDVQASDGAFSNTTTVTITVNVDHCFLNLCKEGSTCVMSDSNYTCNCVEGFMGRYCDKVDYCATNPCQNGGVCNNGATTHTCTCPSGYTGTNCTEIDECETCCCCICRHFPTDLRKVCCIICSIVSIIIALLVIGICLGVTYILHKKKKINVHKLPFLGKCFKDKSKNTDNVDAKQMEPLQTENGHNPESEKTDKHGKNIGDEPEVHREGSPINKNKLSKNSEKGDDMVTTGTPIVEVDGKRLSVNNGENLNDNKYTEVNVESSAM